VAAAEPVIRVGVATATGAFDVREMALEDYVARVLAGEAVPRSAPAALEALAITARTFALANRGRHAREGFDLCTLTHCQVLREPYAAVAAAARATAGEILTWRGAPASVYYTASCGGRTERPSAVWPGASDPAYLPVQKDDGCDGNPRWTTEIAGQDLTRALRAAGYRGGMVRDVRVRARSGSGRVAVLEMRGMSPETITGQALRMAVGRTLGWQLLKSTDFDVHRSGRGYRFAGRGFGHGVGFCVIGSARRAGRGASRTALLQQYFPGTAITTISALASIPGGAGAVPNAVDLASGYAPALMARASADPLAASVERPGVDSADGTPDRPASTSPIVLMLPDGDAEDRLPLSSLADRLLRRAAGATRQPAPARLQIVFHPSTDSFRRQTSEPWWSAAATEGQRIDLQPVDVLRARGVLESTLAHEIGHVVTAGALAGRSAWVQEGAAMYAGGLIASDRSIANARRPSCPSDDELRRPVSAAAARDAYARAQRCFAYALARGVRWDQVH
jgi:stage II sporulation protein D